MGFRVYVTTPAGQRNSEEFGGKESDMPGYEPHLVVAVAGIVRGVVGAVAAPGVVVVPIVICPCRVERGALSIRGKGSWDMGHGLGVQCQVPGCRWLASSKELWELLLLLPPSLSLPPSLFAPEGSQ